MNWKNISSKEDLELALAESFNSPIAIFKHSTRCSVSLMAKKSLELSWDSSEVPTYFLDLIEYREISNFIASHLDVTHQSPQLIGVKNGEVFYHASHSSISSESFKSAISI